MAYETLLNCSNVPTTHHGSHTPAKALKNALKALRRLFQKTQRTRRLIGDTSAEHDRLSGASDEECDNYANERAEQAGH